MRSCAAYTFFPHKSLILKVMEGDSTTSLLIFSNQLETNLKNKARSAVKMRLYGWCPALHLLHLLANWNSRHVVTALKGFTVKFNPKMRDMGICVGSECRLEKNKKQSKTKKKTTMNTNRCGDGKDAGEMHLHPICFFPLIKPCWRPEPQVFGPKTFIQIQQTEILLTANTANQWQVYDVV